MTFKLETFYIKFQFNKWLLTITKW